MILIKVLINEQVVPFLYPCHFKKKSEPCHTLLSCWHLMEIIYNEKWHICWIWFWLSFSPWNRLIMQAFNWVQHRMCSNATSHSNSLFRKKEKCPHLLHASCCRVQDVWVFCRRLPPSPGESAPVRPFLGKEAAKEGLSAEMDASRAH